MRPDWSAERTAGNFTLSAYIHTYINRLLGTTARIDENGILHWRK